MTDMENAKPFVEKRHYYRVNDVMGLNYSVVSCGTKQPAQNDHDREITLASLFTEIDRDFNQATNTLWHENPTIAQALGLLNRKVSMLAAHHLNAPTKSQHAVSYEKLLVNISGCGMAFHSPEQLTRGTRLQLSLQLTPSCIILQLSGKVVACETPLSFEKPGYWMRVEFDDGNETAREQLIQHIVQRQCAKLKHTA